MEYTALFYSRRLKGNQLFVELDENAIAAQAFAFFIAGYETSSNTIAFCLYELALNQEVQDKTRREVRDAMRGGKLTYEAVQEMKYLDMVILGTAALDCIMKISKIKRNSRLFESSRGSKNKIVGDNLGMLI